MQEYIPRKLEYQIKDENGENKTIIIEDSHLLNMALEHPVVVLADSGMGKTLLMENLVKNSRVKTKFLTASDLVNKSRRRLNIQPGETLLIDAFDEMPSSKDESGINNVLDKLDELDYPNFILTCRSIEWNESNKNEITNGYEKIRTVNLLNFSIEDSSKFLVSRGLSVDSASQLINQLDANNLSSFYENPRNLALLAEIDFSNNFMPKTKAELFELATESLWQEVNEKAQNKLGILNQDTVLECAGLIFATYLLTGKQFIYDGITGNTPDEAINIHSLTSSMDTESLRATVKSRLFQFVDDNLTKPWHRSIAEYLGARWLAKEMATPRIRRQILSYLILNDGVIASLRGLFAWLPTFNPNLSKLVINTDPYGLIEYGDTSYFSDADSILLFNALENLAVKNPWFRNNNSWSDAKAEGLVRNSLIGKYKKVLRGKNTNSHFLRTMFDVLKNADFISELYDELILIVHDDEWYYFARFDALLLLSNNYLINTSDFNALISSGSFNSLRLLFEYTNKCGFELLTDEQIVKSIIKSYKFERSNEIESGKFFPHNGSEYYFLDYPVSRIINLLNNINNEILKLGIDEFNLNYDTVKSINSLIITLIRRYIEESNNPLDSEVFYQSITIFDEFKSHGIADDNNEFFTGYFEEYPDKKLELQQLFLEHLHADIIFYRLQRSVLECLYPNSTDIKELLKIIQEQPINKENIKKWEIIINLSRTKDGLTNDIYNLALPYAKKSQKRLAYLEEHRKSRVLTTWELKSIETEKVQKQEDKERHLKDKKLLSQHISQLETGSLQYCITPAEVLFNDYRDIPKELKPFDKLEYYLGETLKESAIEGFKSSLEKYPHTAEDIVNLRISQDKFYRSEAVLMAGIYCRLINGETLNDLVDDTILSASVIYELSHYSHLNLDIDMGHVIKAQVIDRGLKNNLINTLIKPQFEAKSEVILGWHWLEEFDDDFTVNTVIDLISNYKYENNHNLYKLISILSNIKALNNLEPVVKEKITNSTFKNLSESKQSIWLALYSYFNPENFINLVKSYVALQDEIFSQIQSVYKAMKIRPSLVVNAWIVESYSGVYPITDDPFDKSEYIKECLLAISSNVSFEARQILIKLQNNSDPSYTEFITNLLYEQLNNIREANYKLPSLNDLLNILENKTPENCKDLKNLILELLNEIRKQVKSSELDSYKIFYEDGKSKEPKKPHSENYCRDRLTDLLKPYIEPYQFRLETEKDMPDDKRADITCAKGKIQLPIEVKGQWHKDLWTAMNDQLGQLYLKEYQSQGQGIYLVFYFGNTNTKKLKSHKEYKPRNAQELQDFLTDCIHKQYKEGIDVFVMDLSL